MRTTLTLDDDVAVKLKAAAKHRPFKVVVNEVLAHSPAAEAGMREEDVLTAIDGRPAAEFTLEQTRALLRREASAAHVRG